MSRRNTEGFLVTQPEYTDRNGKKRRSSRYHVRFKDHRGIWRRVVAFTDHSASMSFGRKIRQLDDLRAVGELPRGELARWVDELTDEVRDKLIGWGILDKRASMAALALVEHIQDWYDSILADGRVVDHAKVVRTHVNRIVDACGFSRFSDIDPETIKQYLAKRQRQDKLERESGKADRRRGFGIETRNSHVRAIRQFCRWMVTQRRAIESPVVGIEIFNIETDRRRLRRALSLDDLLHLLNVTHHGPTRGRTTGPERSLVYWTAAETGLRASELRSLTAGSFDLAATPPTVTVEAAYSKRRKRDTLSLTDNLAAQLRTHLAKKLPSAAAFTIPTQTAEMIRADLARAKIPYRDPDTGEVFDFHSLRVQCATDLARGGASVAVAQARMRHSDPKLTMNIYTKLGKDGQAAALDALPRLSVGA